MVVYIKIHNDSSIKCPIGEILTNTRRLPKNYHRSHAVEKETHTQGNLSTSKVDQKPEDKILGSSRHDTIEQQFNQEQSYSADTQQFL